MRFLLFLTLFLSLRVQSMAQVFHNFGKIIYEKKVVIPKWDSNKQGKDETPDITSWEFVFNASESLYKRQLLSTESIYSIYSKQDVFFTRLDKKQRVIKRVLQNKSYIINDTIPKVKWKILPDTRNIAGYECRKAIGVISDSVYVVAFYSEQLLFKGGPEGFTGLPGTILGLAIPRYHTTWFATDVGFPKVDLQDSTKLFNGESLDTQSKVESLAKEILSPDYSKEKAIRFIKNSLYGFLL